MTIRPSAFSCLATTIAFAGLLTACSSIGNHPTAASAASTPAKMESGRLVGKSGMTLYVFDKDANGKSACNGKCAENWPPLDAQGNESGDFGSITRDDGKKQVTYKGKPLYYWIKDQKPGDASGEGVNNVWHIAK